MDTGGNNNNDYKQLQPIYAVKIKWIPVVIFKTVKLKH